jgi:hypothetical protein
MILEPIVQSLMLLESDDGVDVSVNGCIVKVRAALAIFSADNLGYHSLFGFLESFSANKFCRFCEAAKEDAQTYEQFSVSHFTFCLLFSNVHLKVNLCCCRRSKY